MKGTYSSFFLCYSLSLLSSAGLSEAKAADAADSVPASSPAAENQGTDIIVTAQKREQRLNDVPMSITAARSDVLASHGVTDTSQLGKVVPGFTYQKSAYGLPVYYIRGVGFYDTTLGVSPAVTTYVDQIPLPYSTMGAGAFLDIERVEVLKGPQGTLFGENSTGGAINYIAAKPTDVMSVGAKLDIGRFNAINGEMYLSGPLTDTLSARLAVRREYSDRWQKSYVNSDTIGNRDFYNARLTLDWKPAETVQFVLSASGWKDRSDPQMAQFMFYFPIGTRPATFPVSSFPAAPRNDRAAAWDSGENFRRNDSFYQFALKGQIDLTSNVQLISSTSYAHSKVYYPFDFDATSLPVAKVATTGSISSFYQEVRLAGKFGDPRNNWTIGANYQNDKVDELSVFPYIMTTSTAIGPFAWDSLNIINNQRIKTISGFANIEYALTSTLVAQASLRYTSQKRDFQGCTQDSGVGDLAFGFSMFSALLSGGAPPAISPGSCVTLSVPRFKPLPIVSNQLDQNNLSWRGGLTWTPQKGSLFYANVTRGYKAGGFPTLPAALETQLTPIPQESILAYELGTKLDFFDRAVHLDAAIFYYDYKDKQLLGYRNVDPLGALPGLVSIPKSRVRGAEASLTVRPTGGLTVTLGGTYLDTKVLSDPTNPTGPFGTTGSFVSQQFPATPKWQGVADANYSFNVNAALGAYVGASVTARSKAQSSLNNGSGGIALLEEELNIPGYTLIDLRAGLEEANSRWKVEVWGRNVANKFYLTNAVHNSDFAYRFTGMPATYGVTLSFKFGG